MILTRRSRPQACFKLCDRPHLHVRGIEPGSSTRDVMAALGRLGCAGLGSGQDFYCFFQNNFNKRMFFLRVAIPTPEK